ncbi:MAG: succinyl-diaminopimelate desuccinylase [Devosia sp.]|uniref:succinyl-diaminopimelate desuccinylase n=1 Tax=Devosia sp. TaxID=1871048 RepID=UPI0026127E32|nr:succinyl-diaminopimelate desuccinylase [Devosia sp.]MDB5541430.1 succinyl-diaminopimelate desuccinylase [Devosia sp.]
MPATPGIDPVPLLTDLIRCPSVTPETAGVLDVLEAALTQLGFACTRLTFEGDGSYPVENLFATRGTTGKHLLFAGHTDVVPPGDTAAWRHPPFAAEIVDGTLYGRGAADMKSGIAAFLAAISRVPEAGRISLAITNDEEADAVNGTDKLMAWAEAQGHRFDFAIVGEPSATARVGDSIKVGRRGSLNGQIRVTGTQGHVAYPDKANNPLPVAAALIGALSGKLDDGTEHFPPSNLEFTSADVGNETTNVIPASVLLRFNVRYNDRWTPQTLLGAVNEVIGNQDAHGTVIAFTVVGRPSRSFLSPLGGGVKMLVETIARRTGIAPELSTGGGTSDARFIAEYCPVVEFGLPGPSMHKVDESVRVADVEELTALYARFITDYFA